MREEKQLEKLNKIAEVLEDDKVSQDEVVEVFENVLKLIGEIKDRLEAEMAKNKNEILEAHKKMYSEIEEVEQKMSDIHFKMSDKMAVDKKEMLEYCAEEVKKCMEMMPEMPDLKPLTDKIKEIEGKISQMPKMPDLSPMEKKHKQMEEEIEKLKEKIQKVSEMPRGKMGMRKVPITASIDLSSQCDGSTKDFALGRRDVIRILGVFCTQFPINYNFSGDWTLSGTTLTLGADVGAPATGQTLWCLAEVLFYS